MEFKQKGRRWRRISGGPASAEGDAIVCLFVFGSFLSLPGEIYSTDIENALSKH